MMNRDSLTGSRIRERRVIAGLKQADLAQQAGISASYLNLIEHNRRRIGGKLLLNIAHVLGVEPSALTEGAEAALIAALREAANDGGLGVAEVERVEHGRDAERPADPRSAACDLDARSVVDRRRDPVDGVDPGR